MKTMKRNFWMLSIMMMLFGFTSCEFMLEETVGYEVSGHWFGDLDMWIGNTKAQGSEIEFMPHGWGYNKGRGVEVDYYWGGTVTHYFDYEIIGGTIYMYFDDPALDCAIRDYRISLDYFTGYMDGVYSSTKFRLSNYEHFWNQFGYSGYFYAKSETMDTDSLWNEDMENDSVCNDSLVTRTVTNDNEEKPLCIRGVNKKE